MKLTSLFEGYNASFERTIPTRYPIGPKPAEVPVIPSDKWLTLKDPAGMTKTFRFRLPEQRALFIDGLINYELAVQHNAKILIQEDTVQVTIGTKDLDTVTEVDKEYASFCDVLYKDVVYNQL